MEAREAKPKHCIHLDLVSEGLVGHPLTSVLLLKYLAFLSFTLQTYVTWLGTFEMCQRSVIFGFRLSFHTQIAEASSFFVHQNLTYSETSGFCDILVSVPLLQYVAQIDTLSVRDTPLWGEYSPVSKSTCILHNLDNIYIYDNSIRYVLSDAICFNFVSHIK